jgi:glycosyltransferase involved in cell wall biosynthesis
MKVLIGGAFSPFSGYGNDGIGMVRAFLRAGADVHLEPSELQPPIPEELAALLTKPLEGAPIDLYINHSNPMKLEATESHRDHCAVTVGWTMWEQTDFGTMEETDTLRDRLKGFDAVVSYDQVSMGGLEPYYDGYSPIVQGGYDPEQWPEVDRDWFADDFYFCMVGMLHWRKNPFAVVQAFHELQQEDAEFAKHARLSLKTMAPGLHSKMEETYSNLRIYYEMWNADKLRAFYTSQHVLLAPSRGEGKNMPALEFQSTGGVVVASDFGGHQQWLNPDYNYAIPVDLVPSVPGNETTRHAEVKVEELKRIMLHLFQNRTEAKEKGRMAATVIPLQSSWDKVIERLMFTLTEAPGGKALWQKWVALDQRGNHADD